MCTRIPKEVKPGTQRGVPGYPKRCTRVPRDFTDLRNNNSHNNIVKLNSCSYNYVGVRVLLGLGFVGQRGEVRVRGQDCRIKYAM
jgi:hypothetical protein